MAKLQRFLDHYGQRLEEGDAALFVGAGVSTPAGFVDWKTLLREVADDLGLNVDIESDLVAVAQYHVNAERSRARLDRLIIDEFTRHAQPTRVHSLIARLPIRTIWTTNYDTLLEEALLAAGRRPDIKRISENLAVSLPRRDAVVYKMHGDVSDPSRAVLTKEDYETYSATREAFTTTLQADLLGKTFLFLGFSFTDPNLDYVLARIRGLLGEHQREHYCLMRPPLDPGAADGAARADWEYQRRKFDLRVADLQRYSIRTVLIDDYAEIPRILELLQDRARSRAVFVSGSESFFDEYPEHLLTELGHRLGEEFLAAGCRLISGLGLGVGAAVLVGAMRWLYAQQGGAAPATEELLSVRPFPIDLPDKQVRQRIWTQHRRNVLSEAGFAVFLAGNRPSASGEREESPGVREEFDIAVELGVVPIPIGATGSAAHSLWEEVVADPARFYGSAEVGEELSTLGDRDAPPRRLVQAVLNVMQKVREVALTVRGRGENG